MTPATLTIRKIAEALALPESTVRYYRDQFEPHIPSSGQGRRRRYPPEAIDVLRFVAEAYAQGRRREEIAADLSAEADGVPLVLAHATRLPSPADEATEALWRLARHVARLGASLERQQATLDVLARRLEDGPAALPPPAALPAPAALPPGDDVAQLKRELVTERELVDRLRRSKLEVERHLARHTHPAPQAAGARPGGILSRLLGRDGGDR